MRIEVRPLKSFCIFENHYIFISQKLWSDIHCCRYWGRKKKYSERVPNSRTFINSQTRSSVVGWLHEESQRRTRALPGTTRLLVTGMVSSTLAYCNSGKSFAFAAVTSVTTTPAEALPSLSLYRSRLWQLRAWSSIFGRTTLHDVGIQHVFPRLPPFNYRLFTVIWLLHLF